MEIRLKWLWDMIKMEMKLLKIVKEKQFKELLFKIMKEDQLSRKYLLMT